MNCLDNKNIDIIDFVVKKYENESSDKVADAFLYSIYKGCEMLKPNNQDVKEDVIDLVINEYKKISNSKADSLLYSIYIGTELLKQKRNPNYTSYYEKDIINLIIDKYKKESGRDADAILYALYMGLEMVKKEELLVFELDGVIKRVIDEYKKTFGNNSIDSFLYNIYMGVQILNNQETSKKYSLNR